MTTTASRLFTLATGPTLALLAAVPATAQGDPFVELSIPDALARAEREQKLAFLYFHNTEAESRRMLSLTFGDDRLRSWLEEHVVAIKVPHTQIGALAHYSVSKFPASMLLRPDRATLYRVQGMTDATTLLMGLSTAILGSAKAERPDGANAVNPMAWLAWANWLFANAPDRPEEVLAAYVWCLDRGETYIPGFREAQFDFLCERIARLKAHTPDAVHALWDRRNRVRGLLTGGIGTDRDAWELVRFNFWVRDELNTLEVFDGLEGRGEAQERAMRVLLELDLQRFVAWERYEQVLTLVPDPYTLIDGRLSAYQASLDPDAPAASEPRSAIVDDGIDYFEALLATGLGADAMKLFDRVTAVVPTGRAFHAFMERTNRLKLYPLTHRIAEKGLPLVNDKGKHKINVQLSLIPSQDEQAADDGKER